MNITDAIDKGFFKVRVARFRRISNGGCDPRFPAPIAGVEQVV
jgi:hypothetical protein